MGKKDREIGVARGDYGGIELVKLVNGKAGKAKEISAT